MLKRSWPGNFRRTITRDKNGKPLKVLEFTPGVAVEVSASEARALMPDIGVCLEAVELDPKRRPRVIEDDVEAPETVEDVTA